MKKNLTQNEALKRIALLKKSIVILSIIILVIANDIVLYKVFYEEDNIVENDLGTDIKSSFMVFDAINKDTKTINPENKKIFDSINYASKDFEAEYNPNVCVVGNKMKHMNNVVSILNYFYQDKIYALNTDEFESNISDYSFCDVFNMSFSVKGDIDKSYYKDFFEDWNGVMVISAGNKETKVRQTQKLVELKDMAPNQVIIVSEGKVNKDDKVKYVDVNYGEEVDIVVPSRDIKVNGQKLAGTSFAAPFIAGSAALMQQMEGKMASGEIKNIILDSDNYIENKKSGGIGDLFLKSGYYDYKIFDFSSLIRNAWFDDENQDKDL